jgi:hypothetical protein
MVGLPPKRLSALAFDLNIVGFKKHDEIHTEMFIMNSVVDKK